jgi:tetratricopeptide (TPR) repeat protein
MENTLNGTSLLRNDAALTDAIRDGRAVLFLGAGASIGATKGNNVKIPNARELGKNIADKFLGPGFDEADFKTICDFAASSRSVRELQTFIHEELSGFEPADFHKLIPTFIWSGIVTTNYDLIIEGAYRSNETRLQDLVVNCRDGDGAPERLGSTGLLYVKLHGCITHYQEVNPPLVASTEQIINHKTGRAGQFAQFLEWAKTKTIIFAGYGMGDFNLRTLFEEIRRDGDNHARHYIVRPGITRVEEDYWLERRVRTINSDFATFLKAVDGQVRSEIRKLAQVAAAASSGSFTRFIAKSGIRESAGLLRYLDSQCEHVSSALAVGTPEPSKFYRGFDLGWETIAHDLDVNRRISRDILETNILTVTRVVEPQLIVLKGHAGGGKSIALRRVAWNAATKHDKLVFWVESGADLDKRSFEEIFGLSNQPIFVFVDDLTEESSNTADFLKHAKRQKWPLVMIGGARVHEWNMRCEELENIVEEVHELNYLSSREIDDLLALLDVHGCLGHLKSLRPDKRHETLSEQYGRQLLVALHEATENATFRDIIADEFDGIQPPEAKLLYLDICSLHRFGPPVRAGLISRVHGIDFEDFNKRFFLPLEEVINLSPDRKTKDWTYKARHPVIAEIVYATGLPTVKEKYDNLIRIISRLNPSYSYDREVLFELIRAQKLADIFKDRVLGADIYDHALKAVGDDWGIFHQRGIYEMRIAGDASSLDRAEFYLEKALEMQSSSGAIKHSLAELALKRSGIAKDSDEREAWRREAEKQASALTSKSRNSYPLHTLAKVAVSRVKDALARAEAIDDELTQEALNAAIKQAEDTLRLGLQTFPNDDRLLTEDASLSDLLKDANKALIALQRAFKTNPRSELIAKRLSRVLRAQGRTDDAVGVLRETLGLNQGSQILHFDLGQTLRETAFDADTTMVDSILYHFQRSFVPGDKQNEARFWYARHLCLAGRWPEAKLIFETLKKLSIPYRQRTGLRAPVLNADGEHRVYYGQIVRNRGDIAFIRSDLDGIECFTALQYVSDGDQIPPENVRVKFNMHFSLSGPVAVGVALA